jgi:septal ring factor EnvC (AmiA/AmiB activator)
MLRPTLMAAALAVAFPAHADADIDALRAELQQLKASYETRIQSLESRLQAAETQANQAAQTADKAEAQANNAEAQVKTADVQTAPLESASDNAASRFNPEISPTSRTAPSPAFCPPACRGRPADFRSPNPNWSCPPVSTRIFAAT